MLVRVFLIENYNYNRLFITSSENILSQMRKVFQQFSLALILSSRDIFWDNVFLQTHTSMFLYIYAFIRKSYNLFYEPEAYLLFKFEANDALYIFIYMVVKFLYFVLIKVVRYVCSLSRHLYCLRDIIFAKNLLKVFIIFSFELLLS